MKIVDPLALVKGFRRVDLSIADAAQLCGVLDDLRCVRARFDRVEAAVAARLRETSATPERDVARGAQRSSRHGSKVMTRAAALEDAPSLSAALDAGSLGGEHVDVYAKVLASLDGPIKTGVVEAAKSLIEAAAESGLTPEEFAASLDAAAERIAADGGMGRLERQRRATRLRTWTDRLTGMWHLSGAFDPESGVTLHGRLEAAMAAIFATKTPSTAPTDPGEKQDHLRALALLAITNGIATNSAANVLRDSHATDDQDIGEVAEPVEKEADECTDHAADEEADKPLDEVADQPVVHTRDEWDAFTQSAGGGTSRFGRPEMSVIIDTANLDSNGNPTVDWGIPVTIPWERVKHLCRSARFRPVIIHNDAVIDADGELDLGRTSRLANRAQRRALCAVYATCAVDGCAVAVHHTKPHHVHWWRHGGPTDFANLLPLCSKHHHCAHEGGWLLTLGPNRELTIELPDGQIMRTGPPRQRAAA